MKNHLLYIVLLFCLQSSLWAGDDICSATNLPTDDPQIFLFDNGLNGGSSVADPPYGDYSGTDTWISFIMPAGGELYILLQTGTMLDPAMALYQGPCDAPKLLYNIVDNNCRQLPNPELHITDLTPGEQYFVRIWAQAGSPNGTVGVILADEYPQLTNFATFGDAAPLGDCILLTPESMQQQGCAWYQIPIDFSKPFTHEMTANFGDRNGSGADGLCLVYQANSQDFCGSSGNGIGAGGMPRSAIFEFDTFRNGNLDDSFFDHTSFNINGDMDHDNSIEGPVWLGNIEDGDDHTIVFSWNPVGNLYELSFDGTVELSGSYDIINNCFGGDNLAWWGYTAATGESFNNHIICPVIEDYFPGPVTYEEVEICFGDEYLGETEDGFYVYLNNPEGADCETQYHVLLNVLEEPQVGNLDTIICFGELIEIEDITYGTPGDYSFTVQNNNGCDSTIFLTIESPEISHSITKSNDINCLETDVDLTIISSTTLPFDVVSYEWDHISTSTTDASITVNSEGNYKVEIIYTFGDIICTVQDSIYVNFDIDPPTITPIADVNIDCNNVQNVTSVVGPQLLPTETGTWHFNGVEISTGNAAPITEPGEYIFELLNTLNGCTNTDTVSVTINTEPPTIDVSVPELLTCDRETIELSVSPALSNYFYNWAGPQGYSSSEATIEISVAGDYLITVTNEYGCTNNTLVTVEENVTPPLFELLGEDIDCIDSIALLRALGTDGSTILWQGQGLNSTSAEVEVDEEGWYYCTVTNEYGCSTTDSTFVTSFQQTPIITALTPDTLIIDVEKGTKDIVTTVSTSTDYEIIWSPSEGLSCDDCLAPTVEGINITTYTMDVMNGYGCSATYEVFIKYIKEPKVTVPNIFSPNGDSNNDFFTVFGNDQIESIQSGSIYDRWGNLVFSTQGTKPNDEASSWDGTYQGQALTPGVYVYKYIILTIGGEQLEFVGDVTLVR